jgi:hypothetical protein
MKANKDEAIRLSETVTQLPPDIAEKVYRIEMLMYFADGHFNPAGVEAVKRALIETRQMSSMPDDSVLYTEHFLK